MTKLKYIVYWPIYTLLGVLYIIRAPQEKQFQFDARLTRIRVLFSDQFRPDRPSKITSTQMYIDGFPK